MKPFKPSQAAVAVALALVAGAAGAVPGYVTSGTNSAITDSSGHCWKTGDWTPDKAAAPCDAVPVAAAPAAPLAEKEAPPPVAAAPQVIEKVSLSSDVLFAFDKAELTPAGQSKLDELAGNLRDAQIDRVQIDGYADRIGTEQYNERLSERRAQAVRDYLAQRLSGQTDRLQAEGRGEADPVTGHQCDNMGPARKSNQKLVACLQPDRRVEVEVLGQRQASAGSAPSTGASGAGSSAPDASTSGSSQSSR